MTDKVQKIRKEVAKMHNLLPIMDGDNISVNYADRICTTLEMYIDSLQEESVSEDLEDAAKNHAVERYKATRDIILAEKCKWSFKAGAEWNSERIKEALLSKVLPCFMHGGEADEVVAKLDEVLNKKK